MVRDAGMFNLSNEGRKLFVVQAVHVRTQPRMQELRATGSFISFSLPTNQN